MMPWFRLRSLRPLRVRLPTYSIASDHRRSDLVFGPAAELVHASASAGSDPGCATASRVLFTFAAVTGTKPLLKIIAGASFAVLAVESSHRSAVAGSTPAGSRCRSDPLLIEDAVAGAHDHATATAIQATPTRGAKSLRSGWISVRSYGAAQSLAVTICASRRIDVRQQVVARLSCGVKYS